MSSRRLVEISTDELARALKKHLREHEALPFGQEASATDKMPSVASGRPIAVPDNHLIRSLLGKDTLKDSHAPGSEGLLFTLVFSLRHATARLALELHTLAETSEAPNPWFGALSPIIGFSALGTHVVKKTSRCCRAFDAYDLPRGCAALCQDGNVFCTEHAAEAWWKAVPGPQSTQATMFHFFADADNLHLYDDSELMRITERFWARFARQRARKEPGELLRALRYFGYESEEELARRGGESLRSIFLSRARALHPDVGGSAEEFVTLRSHYEHLRQRLEARP